MLQFSHPLGLDPFTTQAFGSGDEQQFSDRYYSAFPVNWQAQSNVHALLLNEAGRLVYGGAAIEYLLDAYTKTYGGAAIEYSLGLVVPMEFAGILDGASGFDLARIMGLAFASSFTGTGAMAISKIVPMEFDGAGEVSGSFALQYTFAMAIADAMEAVSGFSVEGQDIPIWVFNARTFAPSRYEGLDVRSLGRIGNALYGAGPSGIYELEGADDDGVDIAASFITRREDFGVPNVKRIAHGYLTGTSDGKLQVRIIDDAGKVYTYETETALGDIVRAVRFKPGKGLKGHAWQIEVRNKAGGTFEIRHIDMLPEILARRIKG